LCQTCQVPQVLDGKLRGLPSGAQLRLHPRVAQRPPAAHNVDTGNHSRTVRVEEVGDGKLALLRCQHVARFSRFRDGDSRASFRANALELHEHRRHQIESEPHRGKLAQQRRHSPVVLQSCSSHPREDVFAGEPGPWYMRLMHVPEQGDARHNEFVDVLPNRAGRSVVAAGQIAVGMYRD
jgi:hypothetical protein